MKQYPLYIAIKNLKFKAFELIFQNLFFIDSGGKLYRCLRKKFIRTVFLISKITHRYLNSSNYLNVAVL